MDPVTIWAAPQKVTKGPRWAGSGSSLVIDSILGERSEGCLAPGRRATLAQVRDSAYTQDGERHIIGFSHKLAACGDGGFMSVAPTTRPGPAQVAPRAGLALALLLSINLFNYIDRQVLSAVLPKLELEASLFHPDDTWRKSKLGSLTTAFMVSYMLLAPVFGWLGDKRPRWALVGIGVIVWSLASGGSGLATTYVMLLLTRCLVGIGEAAYGPVAPAMLSDLYPERKRGQVLAFFYMAIPVGSALGF